MSEPTRTKNPRGQGALLRGEIVDASIALIDETGDASSLTLRGIARRARISAPSIYGHFDDIEALVDAVLEASFTQLAEIVADAMAPAGDPRERLLSAAHAYVAFGWAHPARYRLMFAAGGYATNAIDTFMLVRQTVQSCIDAGTSASTNADADTWMLWAAMHGIATLDKPSRADQLRLGVIDRPALLEAVVTRLARLAPP